MNNSNYDPFPSVPVPNSDDAAVSGWCACSQRLSEAIQKRNTPKTIVVIECYPGVDEEEILRQFESHLAPALVLRSASALLSTKDTETLTAPFLGGEDPVFGFMSAFW